MEMRPALALHTLNIKHKYETMQMQTVMELRGYNLNICNNPENISIIYTTTTIQETTTNVSGPWVTLDLSLTISFTHLLYQYARSPSIKIQDIRIHLFQDKIFLGI